MLVVIALGLRDDRNVNLAGFVVMAGLAKHLAVLEAVIASDRVGDDVIEMVQLLAKVGRAAFTVWTNAFAKALASLESIALGLFGKFVPHTGTGS